MATNNFFPSISTLIKLDDLPQEIGDFGEGITSVFEKIYFNNFFYSSSPSGDYQSFKLSLVGQEIGWSIPGGSGVRLVLNPDEAGQKLSVIPVSMSVQWGIVKYIREFNLPGFDFSPKGFFDLALKIVQVDKEDLLEKAIYIFLGEEENVLETFVNQFNADNPGTLLTLSSDPDPAVVLEDLMTQISQLNINQYELIFDQLINTSIDINEVFNNIRELFRPFLGEFTKDNFEDLLIPKISASIDKIDVALELPRTVLLPMDGDEVIEDENILSKISFEVGSVNFSSERGLKFDTIGEFTFQKSQIKNTGLTLDLKGMKVDLSRTSNIPEADQYGYPKDFMGLYVEEANIGLPTFWKKEDPSTGKKSTAVIKGRNLLIGTGGISGKIGLEADGTGSDDTHLLETKFGGDSGFSLALDAFDITFKQNVITESNIHGRLTIPKFSKDGKDDEPAEIDVDVMLGNGEFMISAKPEEPLKITLPNLLDVYINSGKIGKEDDRFYFEITGGLKFHDMGGGIGEFLPEKIDIQRFRIWSDGQVEIAAGGITKLKSPKTLTIGPVRLTITAIHYGTHEQMHDNQIRKYWYFGFDGGVSINPGGVDARGDGIKFYFTVDNNKSEGRNAHFFLRIQSIAIDLIIPGGSSPEQAALLLSGYLSMKDPAPDSKNKGTEYIGGVSFSLPKVGLSGSAAMRLNPDVPAFLIDVGLELPAPIPLGPTGLGIYGFRGLVGKHYVATKNAAGIPQSGSWYEYYKKKQAPDFKEGIQVSKFELEDGFSIGAGVSFATATDSGRTFSSKVFLLLSIPELFAIQGQAALLKERMGIDSTTDPPFSLFLAITKESVTSEFGVNLRIPESGAVLDGKGLIEMGFFFKDAGAWYMNFGRETPNDKRLQARVLSLFNMYTYLMISGSGIKAGAGVSFGFDKGIGPLRVKLSAFMDLAGRLSFRPAQLGGSIALGGEVAVQVLFIKLGLRVYAFLAAEAPKPLIVTGAVGISVPKPSIFRRKKGGGKTIEATLDFTWTLERELNMGEIQILEPGKAKALNIMSGETFDLLYSPNELPSTPPDVLIDKHVIPVDSFIEIEFLRGMGFDPSSATGSNFYRPPYGASYTELYPPQKGKSKQVEHSYLLSQLNIKIWNPASRSWEDYEPYQAMAPALTNTVVNFSGNIADLKYGSWQAYQPNNYNRLRLLCQNPLSYMEANPLPTESLGFRDNFMSCLEPRRFKSVNFENSPVSILRDEAFSYYKGTILLRVLDGDGRITTESNSFGFTNGLVLPDGSEVELLFEQPAAKIDLKVKTLKSQVEVKYFKKVKISDRFAKLIPSAQWQEAAPSAIVDVEDLTAAIAFEANSDLSNCVDKVVIKGLGTCTEIAWLLQEDGFDLLKEDLGNLILEDGNSCTTAVFEMRWEDKADYQFNKTLPADQAAVNADNDLLKQALEATVQPVWRPDSIFGVEIVTKDHLVGNETKDYINTHTFMFRTAGPVGHFHEFRHNYDVLVKEDKTQEDKLRSLGNYIDYSKCYPNADGKLTDAKPLFYEDPELNLFYKYNFVYTMFQDFGGYKGNVPVTSKLQALILDPSNSNGQQQAIDSEWKETSKTGSEEDKIAPIIRGDVKVLKNLLNPENPGNCSSTPLENPLNIKSTFVTDTLLPDKLYTALFQSAFNGSIYGSEKTVEVHSYVFRTSRYSNFADQINSYFVAYEDDNDPLTLPKVMKSLFSIEKEFGSGDLSNVSSLISTPATFDLQKDIYANGFDRIVTGFLKLPAIAPAETMEVNIIKNTTVGNERIVGVIVRSPEPFNDPKIPESELLGSIMMKYSATQGGAITRSNQASEIFLSKDRSSAFITFNDNGPLIQPGYLYFDFKYLTWNGKAYVEKSSVTNFEVQVQ